MSRTPPVLWAQRKDCIFLTVDVQDCKSPSVKIDNKEGDDFAVLSFAADVGSDRYEMDLELLKSVDVDETKVSTTGRHVVIVIAKKEEEFWPKLVHKKTPPNVKVDWSKWVDSDDEEADQPFDMSQLGDLSALGGMGGMGGMPGMAGMPGMGMGGMGMGMEGMGLDDSDSDDDENEGVPGLETPEEAGGKDANGQGDK